MESTKKGDRIRITAVATSHDEATLAVGAEHVVAYVGGVPSGAIWVCVDGGGVIPALVSSIGDRWTVLDGVDPEEAA